MNETTKKFSLLRPDRAPTSERESESDRRWINCLEFKRKLPGFIFTEACNIFQMKCKYFFSFGGGVGGGDDGGGMRELSVSIVDIGSFIWKCKLDWLCVLFKQWKLFFPEQIKSKSCLDFINISKIWNSEVSFLRSMEFIACLKRDWWQALT